MYYYYYYYYYYFRALWASCILNFETVRKLGKSVWAKALFGRKYMERFESYARCTGLKRRWGHVRGFSRGFQRGIKAREPPLLGIFCSHFCISADREFERGDREFWEHEREILVREEVTVEDSHVRVQIDQTSPFESHPGFKLFVSSSFYGRNWLMNFIWVHTSTYFRLLQLFFG